MGSIRNRGTKDRPNWYMRYVDADGRRKERPSKQATRAEAKQVLAAIESRIARGHVGIVERTAEERARHIVTVDELIARFLGDVENAPGYAPPRLKDIEEYRCQMRSMFKVRVAPTLGKKTAASVKRGDVERLREELTARKLAPASVDRTLTALHRLYSWSKNVDLVDCANPVAGVERPRSVGSVDYLDAGEVARLLAHAEATAPKLYPMIATAIYAGLRKGELFGLRWSDVHLEAGRLDVNRSYELLPKGGKARYLPAHPELVRILREWRKLCPETSERLVFPVENRRHQLVMGARSDTLGLTALLKAAGCHAPAKAWHALRHTFASHFMMARGNILTLQRLLGHSTIEMTMRYAHLAPDFMAEEIGRMSFPRVTSAEVIDFAQARAAAEANGRAMPGDG